MQRELARFIIPLTAQRFSFAGGAGAALAISRRNALLARQQEATAAAEAARAARERAQENAQSAAEVSAKAFEAALRQKAAASELQGQVAIGIASSLVAAGSALVYSGLQSAPSQAPAAMVRG